MVINLVQMNVDLRIKRGEFLHDSAVFFTPDIIGRVQR